MGRESLPDARERDYLVTVRITETFVLTVRAATAKDAEAKVWSGEYTEGGSASDSRWTSVKARLDV